MSTLWAFSTRDADGEIFAAGTDESGQIFSSILAETKDELRFINPTDLKDLTLLGQGTTFEVKREIRVFHPTGGPKFYVAVKRVVSISKSPDELDVC